MRIGLFGFPLTGKSTLFRLLTGAEAPAHAGRGEVQIGVTRVPDPRLERLAEMYKPKRVVPATISRPSTVPSRIAARRNPPRTR